VALYQLYFLGKAGDIRNSDEFEACCDQDAQVFAYHLHEAICDLYSGYELWQETRRVQRFANDGKARPCLDYQCISREMQASILHREEILQESASAFARSRRLLQRLTNLQEVHAWPATAETQKR
jgi:hypothetical protein